MSRTMSTINHHELSLPFFPRIVHHHDEYGRPGYYRNSLQHKYFRAYNMSLESVIFPLQFEYKHVWDISNRSCKITVFVKCVLFSGGNLDFPPRATGCIWRGHTLVSDYFWMGHLTMSISSGSETGPLPESPAA